MVDTDLKLIFANIQELTLISLNSVICREVEDSDRDRRQTEECRRPLVAVSYTHLDVYKRQIMMCSNI